MPTFPEDIFKISLAQWSLHRAILNEEISTLDFPRITAETFGLGACEFVNTFFKDKAQDQSYLNELKQRADDVNVKCLLIMCDHEGALGDPEKRKREQAVENHLRWVEAARHLGCHAIRVNARSVGSAEEQQNLMADGLRQLALLAQPFDINVLVENHGGLSSNAPWLVGIMRKVNLSNCGTLPDFGNFLLDDGSNYDRYKGVTEMMPFAKAVSAKSNRFNEKGEEAEIDYHRMIEIVTGACYHGYFGIEYEGDQLSEHDGIMATKVLLERIRDELAEL